ncbi:hypothetical protein COT72_03415 [archaeon CG10_big_fil_rev_8_21_14_0_10_43_11]|nr:MAG: hypothetical protein COT72_03415 [archaeon CG10_big_fil_rev_8_21_14_0_10_43_11]
MVRGIRKKSKDVTVEDVSRSKAEMEAQLKRVRETYARVFGEFKTAVEAVAKEGVAKEHVEELVKKTSLMINHFTVMVKTVDFSQAAIKDVRDAAEYVFKAFNVIVSVPANATAEERVNVIASQIDQLDRLYATVGKNAKGKRLASIQRFIPNSQQRFADLRARQAQWLKNPVYRNPVVKNLIRAYETQAAFVGELKDVQTFMETFQTQAMKEVQEKRELFSQNVQNQKQSFDVLVSQMKNAISERGILRILASLHAQGAEVPPELDSNLVNEALKRLVNGFGAANTSIIALYESLIHYVNALHEAILKFDDTIFDTLVTNIIKNMRYYRGVYEDALELFKNEKKETFDEHIHKPYTKLTDNFKKLLSKPRAIPFDTFKKIVPKESLLLGGEKNEWFIAVQEFYNQLFVLAQLYPKDVGKLAGDSAKDLLQYLFDLSKDIPSSSRPEDYLQWSLYADTYAPFKEYVANIFNKQPETINLEEFRPLAQNLIVGVGELVGKFKTIYEKLLSNRNLRALASAMNKDTKSVIDLLNEWDAEMTRFSQGLSAIGENPNVLVESKKK